MAGSSHAVWTSEAYEFRRVGDATISGVEDVFADPAFEDAWCLPEERELYANVRARPGAIFYMVKDNFFAKEYSYVVYVASLPAAVFTATCTLDAEKYGIDDAALAGPGAVNVGFVLKTAYQKKGHATRMLAAFCAWIADNWASLPSDGPGLNPPPTHLLGITRPDNAPACALLLRGGFVERPDAARPGVAVYIRRLAQ